MSFLSSFFSVFLTFAFFAVLLLPIVECYLNGTNGVDDETAILEHLKQGINPEISFVDIDKYLQLSKFNFETLQILSLKTKKLLVSGRSLKAQNSP